MRAPDGDRHAALACRAMRAMFWIYSTVIVAGLAYFIVIGLSHH